MSKLEDQSGVNMSTTLIKACFSLFIIIVKLFRIIYVLTVENVRT